MKDPSGNPGADIDLDRYCTGCNSDKHTEPRYDDVSLLWCGVCWDWQKPLAPQIKNLLIASCAKSSGNPGVTFESFEIDGEETEDGITVGVGGGRIILAVGLCVDAYLSPRDGALVVQIDTPAEGEHGEQHNRARVYINDARAATWVNAV